MRILYLTTRGVNDPTGASLALHLAANGSLANGDDVAVVLGGDATDLVRGGVAEAVQGVGIPPLKDLFARLAEHAVPVYV